MVTLLMTAASALLGCGASPLLGADAPPTQDPLRLGPPVTLAEVPGPWSLRADTSDLYWLSYGLNPGSGTSVSRMPQAGGAPSAVWMGGGFNNLLVSSDGSIYGADLDVLWGVPSGGGSLEELARPGFCAVGTVSPDAVWCANGQGLTRIDLQTRSTARIGESGGYTADSIALDDRFAYWTAGGELLAVARNGGATQRLIASIASSPTSTSWAQAVATDDRFVFAAATETLWRIDTQTGVRRSIHDARIFQVAARNGFVYWVEAVSGTIRAVAAGGGPEITIAEGESNIDSLTVTATGVFWINAVPDFSIGRIRGAYFATPN